MKILTGFFLEELRPQPHNWYRLHCLCANLYHVSRVFPEIEIYTYLTYGAYNECRSYAQKFGKEFDFIGPNVHICQLTGEYRRNYNFFYDNIRPYFMLQADDDCLILDADMNLYLDSRNWLLNLKMTENEYWCENYQEDEKRIQEVLQENKTWDVGIYQHVADKYGFCNNGKAPLGPNCLAVFPKAVANELGAVVLDTWQYVDQHRKKLEYSDRDLSDQFAEIVSCSIEAFYFLAKGGTIHNIDSTFFTHAQGGLPRFPGDIQCQYEDGKYLFQTDFDTRLRCYERYWEKLITEDKAYTQQEAIDLFISLNSKDLEIQINTI